VLTPTQRLNALLVRQRAKRDEAFTGPIPSHEQFLVARGVDAEISEQIEAVKIELSGKEDEGD